MVTLAVVAWTDVWGTVSDIVAAVFTLAATAGVFLVLWQIQLQRKQLHRDLENMYIERYWVILDRLEESEAGTPANDRAVKAYLSLCEDQCDMRAQDRVTDETWKIWGPSIFQQIHEPVFAASLTEQPDDLFLQIRTMLNYGEDYDPSELTPKQRRKLGL